MFLLMWKDEVCATFDFETTDLGNHFINPKQVSELPVGCTINNLSKWLSGRNAAKHRSHLTKYLSSFGVNDTKGFLELTHGISLNDCFWVKQDSEDLTWDRVSPYRNEFDEVVQKLAFAGVGMYGEKFSPTSPEFGTSGAYDKCWIRDNDAICMIKRGSDVASNSGLEPYGEVLASQVFTAMRAGIPYKLVKYHDKIASKCKLFNNEERSFVPYGHMDLSTDLVDMVKFYDDLGSDLFRRILVCDALTLNTDRHTGNHGIFYVRDKRKMFAAPGYDYNLSLCPYLTSDDFAQFNIHYDEYAPRMGGNFVTIARKVLTPQIQKDLINLKGIKLELPFYTDEFPKERCEWLTELVNTQIENILSDKNIIPKFNVPNISNCMKYRMKLGLTEEKWYQEVPRLMQIFNIHHMDELEREIGKLL